MSDIIFALATTSDIQKLVAMKLTMFAESGHADLLADNAKELIEADYFALYKSELAQHFVAKSGTEIVSCTGAFLKSELPFRYFRQPLQGFIGDVYTYPSYRGRGLASQLARTAMDWLTCHGAPMIRLLASDMGRPIYEKLGFQASDEMVYVHQSIQPHE